MGFSKSAALISVLLFLSFGFQMIAVVSVPVTTQITLANFNGYIYGVWGYCKADGTSCSGIHVGYEEIPSGESFSLPRSARHSLSKLLIVHVVSTGCTLLLFLGALVTNFTGGPRYLLVLLVCAVPVFLVSLLAFLVEILLFLSHLSFAGWFTLVGVVLNAASFVVLCLFRRSKASKIAAADNSDDYGEIGELSHVGLLHDQDEEKLLKPGMFQVTRLDSNDSSRSATSHPSQRFNGNNSSSNLLPNQASTNFTPRQPPLPVQDRRPTYNGNAALPPRPEPPQHQVRPIPAGTYVQGMDSPSLTDMPAAQAAEDEMARPRQAPQGHPTMNKPMVARSTSHQAIVDYAGEDRSQPLPPAHGQGRMGPSHRSKPLPPTHGGQGYGQSHGSRSANLNINTASMYRTDLPPVDSEPPTPVGALPGPLPTNYQPRPSNARAQQTPLERFIAEPAPTAYKEEPPVHHYAYEAPNSPTGSDASAYTSISQRPPVYQYSHPPTVAGPVPLSAPTRSDLALDSNPDFSLGQRSNRFNKRKPGRPMGPF